VAPSRPYRASSSDISTFAGGPGTEGVSGQRGSAAAEGRRPGGGGLFAKVDQIPGDDDL
jgi:hypothetical protein